MDSNKMPREYSLVNNHWQANDSIGFFGAKRAYPHVASYELNRATRDATIKHTDCMGPNELELIKRILDDKTVTLYVKIHNINAVQRRHVGSSSKVDDWVFDPAEARNRIVLANTIDPFEFGNIMKSPKTEWPSL